jgi:hypothetical protein
MMAEAVDCPKALKDEKTDVRNHFGEVEGEGKPLGDVEAAGGRKCGVRVTAKKKETACLAGKRAL